MTIATIFTPKNILVAFTGLLLLSFAVTGCTASRAGIKDMQFLEVTYENGSTETILVSNKKISQDFVGSTDLTIGGEILHNVKSFRGVTVVVD